MNGQLRLLDVCLLLLLGCIGMFWRDIRDAWRGRKYWSAERRTFKEFRKWWDHDRDYER